VGTRKGESDRGKGREMRGGKLVGGDKGGEGGGDEVVGWGGGGGVVEGDKEGEGGRGGGEWGG